MVEVGSQNIEGCSNFLLSYLACSQIFIITTLATAQNGPKKKKETTGDGWREPTATAPGGMDGGWEGNTFSLGSISLVFEEMPSRNTGRW
jgi:hypothetical protein